MDQLVVSFGELSASHQRTMDILSKGQKTIRLEDICIEQISRDTVGALLDRQLHYTSKTALLNGRNGPYIPTHIEETLRKWYKYVPVRLKEDLLTNAVRVLQTLLGSDRHRIAPNFRSNDPLPMLVASLFQVLFDSKFGKVSVPLVLQWVKESRLKVLHLLHYTSNPLLTEISFDCYSSNSQILQPIPFSEEYLLTNCFNKFPKLKSVSLPYVCTNDILAQLANCCPLLESLMISGSDKVTDQGLEYFTSCDSDSCNVPTPQQRPHQPSKVDLKDPRTRVGFQATPIIAGCTDQLKMFQMLKAKKVNLSTRPLTLKRPMKRLDLSDTGVTFKGAEHALRCFKELCILKLDQGTWRYLFKGLSSEELCFDCIGVCPKVRSISYEDNVAAYLPIIYDLFPNLQHLTVDLSRLRDLST